MTKVFETTLPIAYISPQKCILKRWWLKLRAVCRQALIITQLDPVQVIEKMLRNYANNHLGFPVFSFLETSIQVALRYRPYNRQTMLIHHIADKTCTIVKVLTKEPKGEVLSATWLLRLTKYEATLRLYLPCR